MEGQHDSTCRIKSRCSNHCRRNERPTSVTSYIKFSLPSPDLVSQNKNTIPSGAGHDTTLHASRPPSLKKKCCAPLAVGLSQDQAPGVLVRHRLLSGHPLCPARLYRILLLQQRPAQGSHASLVPRPQELTRLGNSPLTGAAWPAPQSLPPTTFA